jgi:hypothetical protein
MTTLTPLQATPNTTSGEPGPSSHPSATKTRRTVRLFAQLPEESSSDEEGPVTVTDGLDDGEKVYMPCE